MLPIIFLMSTTPALKYSLQKWYDRAKYFFFNALDGIVEFVIALKLSR